MPPGIDRPGLVNVPGPDRPFSMPWGWAGPATKHY